jgi:UDP-N-acetylglucosamine 2-epimerase (non-hydrolysing)
MGTRPEVIKLAPVIHKLRARRDRFETVVCSTGQHREMLSQALRAFDIVPDRNLDLMTSDQSLSGITASVVTRFSEVLATERPDLVLVQGDTTTAFCASLAAFYQRIPVGHVEAGLRTDNKYSPFPEEINRRLITHIADFHFAPTGVAQANLLREGVGPHRILVTGNTVIDALLYVRNRLRENPSLALHSPQLESRNGSRLILVTAHRRESFGRPLQQICEAISTLARERADIVIVYPVHLNPNVAKPVHRLLGSLPNVKLLDPLDYVSFVSLMDQASILLTDSGGLQEEGPALGKPVLVMRETSERPEAIAAGCALLVGTEPKRIVETIERLLDNPEMYQRMADSPNPYGDGTAAEQIVNFLAARMGVPSEPTAAT